MSLLLSLPRELRDLVYVFTIDCDQPRRFTSIGRNEEGMIIDRITTSLLRPPGRLASSAPGLFLVNHQVSVEYAETCSKIKPTSLHVLLSYEYPNIDISSSPRLPRGEFHDFLLRAEKLTFDVWTGPEWGSRHASQIVHASIREGVAISSAFRRAYPGNFFKCNCTGLINSEQYATATDFHTSNFRAFISGGEPWYTLMETPSTVVDITRDEYEQEHAEAEHNIAFTAFVASML